MSSASARSCRSRPSSSMRSISTAIRSSTSRLRDVSRVLADHLPAANTVPRLVTANPDDAAGFAKQALAAGHEGVMAKSLDGLYAAGRRGSAWLKVKQAHTLDLVILAAEWGSGRRRGTLSNLHLGARDDAARRIRHAGQDLQGADRRDAGLANGQVSGARDRARRLHRACPPRARRRNCVQRCAGQPAVSRRAGAPVRASEALSDGQDRGRGGHASRPCRKSTSRRPGYGPPEVRTLRTVQCGR